VTCLFRVAPAVVEPPRQNSRHGMPRSGVDTRGRRLADSHRLKAYLALRDKRYCAMSLQRTRLAMAELASPHVSQVAEVNRESKLRPSSDRFNREISPT